MFYRMKPFVKRNCLMESLIYFKFLREAGIDAKINVGIRGNSTSKTGDWAHCWITVGGKPLTKISWAEKEFARIYSFPD